MQALGVSGSHRANRGVERSRMVGRDPLVGTLGGSAMSDETLEILRSSAHDPKVLGSILERHRERLSQLVQFRMPPALLDCMEPSDVVQETFVEATRRVEEYIRKPSVPFYLWLRFLALQKIVQLRRRQQARKRDIRRERRVERWAAGSSSTNLVEKLFDSGTSPSGALQRKEKIEEVLRLLGDLGKEDRDVLELRHFEELSNVEAAEVLGITPVAARSRYFRALQRLKEVLDRKREG
jgi:RNA polymerase sigma-70 factor (ECF subfamily)